jgi:hypothetical protein
MLRRRHVPVFPLGALPVVVAATVALIFAQTRNRAPAEAAFVVLAAAALDHLRPRPPKRTTQAESLPMGA